MNKCHAVFLLCMSGGPLSAGTVEWGTLRDGDLYLSAAHTTELNVSWQPAWQADANREQLYLLDGQGRLDQLLDIAPEQVRGQWSAQLRPGPGDYRLSIPGYSFRGYQVRLGDSVNALFEPVRVHFNSEVPAATELYFRVAAGEQAVLAGKYHGGVEVLQATRLTDGTTLRLPLNRYQQYWRFDSLPLPVSIEPQIWRLSLGGSGKAAFWLDGTDNLFARNVRHLRGLDLPPGQVTLQVSERVLGPAPRLGVALPYVDPPASSHEILHHLSVRAASFYSFVDVLPREPQREIGYRRLYNETFDIDTGITLLAGTGRRAVLRSDSQAQAGLRAWLADSVNLPTATHYLAFADEPNLNYPGYAAFARYFASMLEHYKAMPEARNAGVRIAMPASSRLLDGPLRPGAAGRRGIDWADRLLQEHAADIDALAWHEWMTRDLLATRRYRDRVQAAADLVGIDASGRPRKALLLDQTNISSGNSLSLHEQDTHFAALWWMSVIVNASQDGLLDMLSWFQVADEPEYPKGMLRQLDNGRFEMKPVGLAQQFIARHWLGSVHALDNSSFEVDVLALGEAEQRVLLGVNKVHRPQQVQLGGVKGDCASLRLWLFTAEAREVPVKPVCSVTGIEFTLPAETLFALYWEHGSNA